MIRAISKSNFGIILKNISLAAVLVLGLSQTAKADETNNHQDLHIACDPEINQDSKLNCSFNELIEVNQIAETKIAQTRRGRRRKSKVDGYYGGFTLGVGFPSGSAGEDEEFNGQTLESPDYSTSFDGSIFGGIKFTKNISADLEFFLALGGIDSDDSEESIIDAVEGAEEAGVSADIDGDFSAFALYINPRFELPVNDKISLYASPGIGLSQTNVNINADVDVEGGGSIPVIDQDASNTGISFQIKGGAEYQISNSLDIFGQVRYVTLPTDDDLDSINIFGLDTGLKFNF